MTQAGRIRKTLPPALRTSLAWAAIIALMYLFAYYSLSPRHVTNVEGLTIGAGGPESKYFPGRLGVTVQTDDNAVISLLLPRGVAYKAGARVQVEIMKRDWPPGAETYRFVRYVE